MSIQSYIIATLLLLTSSTFRQNKEKKEQKKHIGRFEHLCSNLTQQRRYDEASFMNNDIRELEIINFRQESI